MGRAEEVLRRTVALPAASARAWNELANVIYGQRRFEESLEFYRQAIAKSPGAAVYHANLAGALLRLNRREEALAAARQAKALGIQTHWALKQLGF